MLRESSFRKVSRPDSSPSKIPSIQLPHGLPRTRGASKQHKNADSVLRLRRWRISQMYHNSLDGSILRTLLACKNSIKIQQNKNFWTYQFHLSNRHLPHLPTQPYWLAPPHDWVLQTLNG